MKKPSRLVLPGIALACATILAACGGGSSAPTVTSVTVAPVSGEIYVSAAPAGGVRGAAARRPAVSPPAVTASCHPLQYTATALLSNKMTLDVSSSPDTTWTSSSTSVASISATGLATGVGLGTTNITASYKGASSAGEPLAVDQLNSITVSPSLVTLASGASQQYAAAGHFTLAAGSSSDFDVSSQVTWDSTDKTVATIDSTGDATVVGQGSTTITATSCDGTIVGHATLNVSTPTANSLVITPTPITISTGTTTLFTAMEKLPDNTIQALPAGTVVTWNSDTTNVASVVAASATMALAEPDSTVVQGLSTGKSNITATASGFNPGSAVLTVQAASASFAYVANGQGGTPAIGNISGYSVDVTSATTPLVTLGAPVTASTPQQSLLHPSGDLMYYIDAGGAVHVDQFNPLHVNPFDGSFAETGQTPMNASLQSSFNVGVIDPTGRFLYVTSFDDNTIFGFSITQTPDKGKATNGVLTPIPGMDLPNGYSDTTLQGPTWIMTDRAGKYLYVVNSVGSTIGEYSIDPSTGLLTPLTDSTSVPTGASPSYGSTDVNGHLFVANTGDNTVSVFSIDSSTGKLGPIAQTAGTNFPVVGASSIVNVITDPTGKYLYVLDSTAQAAPATPQSQVFAFNLNASGVIGSAIGNPQPTGASPNGMAIDPTGALLAIDNNFDGTLSLFQITATGLAGAGGLSAQTTVPADTEAQFVVFYTAAGDQ